MNTLRKLNINQEEATIILKACKTTLDALLRDRVAELKREISLLREKGASHR